MLAESIADEPARTEGGLFQLFKSKLVPDLPYLPNYLAREFRVS